MNEHSSAANHPLLRKIKQTAIDGGDRGPLYDRGVLDTIAMIERDNSFVRNRMVNLFLLFGVHRSAGCILEDAELAECEAFMRDHSWSFPETMQYIDGIDFVERMLWLFEDRKSDD